MKTILTMVLLACTSVYAQRSPKMRINFGASSSVVRISTGVFNNPAPLIARSAEGKPGDSIYGLMRSGVRVDLEAMVMVNNRFHFAESVMHNPPRFLTMRLDYDGFSNQALGAIGFAQGLNCRTWLPIFGQVRGYWGVGAGLRYNTGPYGEPLDIKSIPGARTSLNVYNQNSAMQSEVFVFRDAVFVTTQVHKKLGKHTLVNFGVTNNQPKVGASVMIGSCRLGVSTQWHRRSFQSGVNFTANL